MQKLITSRRGCISCTESDKYKGYTDVSSSTENNRCAAAHFSIYYRDRTGLQSQKVAPPVHGNRKAASKVGTIPRQDFLRVCWHRYCLCQGERTDRIPDRRIGRIPVLRDGLALGFMLVNRSNIMPGMNLNAGFIGGTCDRNRTWIRHRWASWNPGIMVRKDSASNRTGENVVFGVIRQISALLANLRWAWRFSFAGVTGQSHACGSTTPQMPAQTKSV